MFSTLNISLSFCTFVHISSLSFQLKSNLCVWLAFCHVLKSGLSIMTLGLKFAVKKCNRKEISFTICIFLTFMLHKGHVFRAFFLDISCFYCNGPMLLHAWMCSTSVLSYVATVLKLQTGMNSFCFNFSFCTSLIKDSFIFRLSYQLFTSINS